MDMAQKELKQVIPQRMQIPSTQLRLLQSVGHGQFAVQQYYSLSIFLQMYAQHLVLNCAVLTVILSSLLTGEFGEVYKARLIAWHGQGDPRIVAVKTLRG